MGKHRISAFLKTIARWSKIYQAGAARIRYGQHVTSRSSFYAQKIANVLTYLVRALNDGEADLSLDALATVAGLSKFHFHRQFAALTGTTVARLVSHWRLKQASMQLAFKPEARVTDIALQAGYGSLEAFSRAFRDMQTQSPSDFRRTPQWQQWTAAFANPLTNQELMMSAADVTIVDFPPTIVAVLEHRGAPATLMASVARFIAWRKSSTDSPIRTSQTYGVAYDDPEATPPEQFRFDICGTLTAPVADNTFGVITKTLPGGKCAVVTHIGSTDAIGPSVMRLYRDWLPTSGQQLRDAPLFFHYKKRMPEVTEPEQVTDIYLPLQ